MDILIVSLAALAASTLTLFSGFGLGTLLMPVFALFFSVEIAIAQTALVHFANNLFKLWLFRKHADWRIVFLFGVPAFFTSFLGAKSLLWLSDLEPLFTYVLLGRQYTVQTVKLVIAVLMAFFSILELRPAAKQFKISRTFIPAGGILSGFFGGLSGNQGAFRSAFLIKSGLGKEAFIATGVVIAAMVDFSRLSVYAQLIWSQEIQANLSMIAAATLAAFIGVFFGKRLVGKMTIRSIRIIVAVMLLFIALLLGMGVI
jgi:uncharacterized protein